MRDFLSRLGCTRSFLGLFFVALLTTLSSTQGQPTAFDLSGKPLNPLTASKGKSIVLIFVRKDCPISSRYAPTIQQLSARYRSDAQFFLVFPDKAESPTEIRKYMHDFAYTLPALRDPDHFLVKLGHARVTPEAAVFDARGGLVYHGRIDNLYEDIARARPQATTHELDSALQSAIHGTPLLARETDAVGCYISDLP